MLCANRSHDGRIVRRDCRARAQGRLHQSRRARARSACAACGAARAGAGSAGAEAANSAAGGALHHAGIHAAKTSAGLGTQYVHLGDGQIVARDRQVKIVLERQPDGILE